MNFYGTMPDSFNLVVNTDHPLVKKIVSEKDCDMGDKLKAITGELEPVSAELNTLKEQLKNKKEAHGVQPRLRRRNHPCQ